MIQLGSKAKDKITGFTGVAIGRAEYLTGCTQILLTPDKLTKDGKRPEGEWFDEQRLEVIQNKRISFDNTRTPGPDKEAPKN